MNKSLIILNKKFTSSKQRKKVVAYPLLTFILILILCIFNLLVNLLVNLKAFKSINNNIIELKLEVENLNLEIKEFRKGLEKSKIIEAEQ